MNPAIKRFEKRFAGLADVVAKSGVDQLQREALADAMTEVLRGQPDFRPDLFRMLASDPLCECEGFTDRDTRETVPCPDGRWIRIAMHLRDAPDGRSAVWQIDKPKVRCVSCGAKEFVPGYPQTAAA